MCSHEDRRTTKRPLDPLDPEAERRSEQDLREQAQREQAQRERPLARKGDLDPPPPSWNKQQDRKKEERRHRTQDLQRKDKQHQFCSNRVGDPFAKKPKHKPSGSLALPAQAPLALSSSLQGMALAPILVEEADRPECFKCGRIGHFRSQHQFKPLCVLCKEDGHASAYYPSRGKSLMLQTMGHAIPGEGFFCLQFEEEDDEDSGVLGGNAAIISADPGTLSQQILEDELRNLVEGAWDWQVVQISEAEFTVVFPSLDMLWMATRSGKLFLPHNNITTRIHELVWEEPKGEVMPEVWVRLSGVPKKHRREDRLMAAMSMIGRPLVVDELSLIRPGPVRMKIACCAPAKLRGMVKIWFNNIGYNITLEPELKPMHKSGGPPPPNQNNGKGPDGDDKDKEESMDDESIDTEAWDKLGDKGQDGGASNGASAMAVNSVPPPAPSSHPQATAKGGPGSARASNLLSPLVPSVPVVPEADPKGIPVSCEGSGLAVQFSPLSVSVGGSSPSNVLDKTLPLTPAPTTVNLPPEDRADIGWASHASWEFSKRNSGGQANKKTGRKKASRAVPVLEGTSAPETPRPVVMALASPHPASGTGGGERSTPPSGDPLRDKVAVVALISKAKRSKAATIGPRRSSVRPKGDLSSLESAELLIAKKNLELTDLLSLIQSKELAQAALARRQLRLRLRRLACK
ncbi:hypothetical protein CFC21_103629 [Triticum aestivum]|uniref:DUF4283 domain-containing protein n=2 Tax=Triticum aestivum TaxID=4565 RepID=A0A9R1M8H9_WHEAT|nr:hypothetical protein CFC21_103629 [Triticum aestivum]